jgi:transcriptional regulator with XRE-family HTH domain
MIRRLRRSNGWSQARLAELLNAAADRDTNTRHDVYRWEAGKRVPHVWLPTLAQVLNVPRETLERATVGTSQPGPLATIAELLPADSDPLLPLSTTRTGHQIGNQTVDDLFGRIHGLRLADDVVAGGDLMVPAFRELRSVSRLYRESTHTEEVGTKLLVAIGELAQIAGWIASDAGRHGQAEQAYHLGISAARQAEDNTLTGNLIGSLAYQYANTGRPQDSVTLAKAAIEVTGPDAPPRARALAYDREAWAFTKTDRAQEAMWALGIAREALHARTDQDRGELAYLYWVTAEELDIMEARCYTELSRPLRAVPLLTTVLDRYDAAHARELALYLSWLAIAYIAANEPEEAAKTTRRMVTVAGDLSSERLITRARAVFERLSPFDHIPDVADVLSLLSEGF